jgi:hypothetical protein
VDSVENIKETARDAYEDLKTAAHDHIVEPLAATGRKISRAAHDSAETAADYDAAVWTALNHGSPQIRFPLWGSLSVRHSGRRVSPRQMPPVRRRGNP